MTGVQEYFGFLGSLALVLSLIGRGKRSGDQEHDLAAGYLAMEAWRWFLWIAAGSALLFIADSLGGW